ncbi:MAG: hypothetical protein ACR2HA_05235 [Nocardioides sp.]
MHSPPHRGAPVARPPQGLVRPVPIDPTGRTGPTRGQAAGTRWRTNSRGFHVPAWVDGDCPEQRVLEQSLRLPAGGAVMGWAGCRLLSANFFDGLARDGVTRLPVPLALGRGGNIREDDRVTVSRDPLLDDEVVWVYGIPCTTPERATFDAVRTATDLMEAVVALDMAFAGEVTSMSRMRAYVADTAGWKGVPLVRQALELASEHSWSPNETRLRMIWQLGAGLPRPLVNRPVFDRRGRLLGYPDLLDVESGLVGEFDGGDHRGAGRHADDVGREATLRNHWLEVVRGTGPDLLRPERVQARILAARQRARWLPPDRRPWSMTPPPGWDPGPTLDERLAHRDFMADARRQWERDGCAP